MDELKAGMKLVKKQSGGEFQIIDILTVRCIDGEETKTLYSVSSHHCMTRAEVVEKFYLIES